MPEPENKGDKGILIWMAEHSISEVSNYACPDTAGPLAAIIAQSHLKIWLFN